MVGHFSANDVPSLLKAHCQMLTFLLCWQNCFPFIQHILCRYLQHLQLFGNPSLGIPHKFTLICPPKLTQCPPSTPLELQLKASFSPYHSMMISINTTTKYFFIYAKCIFVALQMGKGVMRRKWGNRGSLQSTLLISTQITVRHCLYSGCSAMENFHGNVIHRDWIHSSCAAQVVHQSDFNASVQKGSTTFTFIHIFKIFALQSKKRLTML